MRKKDFRLFILYLRLGLFARVFDFYSSDIDLRIMFQPAAEIINTGGNVGGLGLTEKDQIEFQRITLSSTFCLFTITNDPGQYFAKFIIGQ